MTISRRIKLPIAILICTACLAYSAFAQRPGSGGGGGGGDGGGGTGGKILFRVSDTYRSMNPDGSQVETFFDHGIAYDSWLAVSSKQYSGRRWILVFEEVGTTQYCDSDGANPRGTVHLMELFAYRSDGVKIQLTDVSKWGLNNDANVSSDVSVVWSNDNQDTFFSVRLGGFEVFHHEEKDYYVLEDYPHFIARIALGGGELDSIAARNTDEDPGNDWPLIGELTDPRQGQDPLCTLIWTGTPSLDYYDRRTHGWSPDGTQLLYTERDNNGFDNLYCYDLLIATERLVLPDLGSQFDLVDWSPDGTKIAVVAGGDILVVNPNGTGLETLRAANPNKNLYYGCPYWSPDGLYLAYIVRKSSGSYAAKLPLAGGKEVTLTSAAYVHGWTAE
ncbi:MAG: TolB family protein [Pirellulaceae bacterium]